MALVEVDARARGAKRFHELGIEAAGCRRRAYSRPKSLRSNPLGSLRPRLDRGTPEISLGAGSGVVWIASRTKIMLLSVMSSFPSHIPQAGQVPRWYRAVARNRSLRQSKKGAL